MAQMPQDDEDLYNQRALDRVLAPQRNAGRRGSAPAPSATTPAAPDVPPAEPVASNDLESRYGAPDGTPADPASDIIRRKMRDFPAGPLKPSTRDAGLEDAGAPSAAGVEMPVTPGPSPSAATPPAAAGGRLEGFGGMLEDGRSKLEYSDSPKYQVARVLQKYPSTPAGLQAALAEINALGLGTASITGSKGDRLSFGGQVDPRFNGITEFDVIRGAGNGGEAWQWSDPNDTGASAPSSARGGSLAAQGPASAASNGLLDQMSQGGTQESLLAKIQAILGAPSIDQAALMRALGGA